MNKKICKTHLLPYIIVKCKVFSVVPISRDFIQITVKYYSYFPWSITQINRLIPLGYLFPLIRKVIKVILSTLGDIRTIVNDLDREKQSMYKISVQAKDMPNMISGNINTTTVTINVLDINDNMAIFKKSKTSSRKKTKICIIFLFQTKKLFAF